MALLFHSGNVLVKSLTVLIAHCPEMLGRSLSDSLRNAPLKTYYTPQLFGLYKNGHHITTVFTL